ncbi:MAG: hypothetical protein V4574_12665 [Pseudomonadota bacterium]
MLDFIFDALLGSLPRKVQLALAGLLVLFVLILLALFWAAG